MGTLESIAGKENTIRKIHHIGLIPHHGWPDLGQVATLGQSVAAPANISTSLFPNNGAVVEVGLTRRERWAWQVPGAVLLSPM